jgi:hypothetical protein
MADLDPPLCERCAGPTTFAGRISLPAQTIYRCNTCAHEMWLTIGPTSYHRPPTYQPEAQQPQQQQQQQQPEKKKEEDGSGC